MTKRYTMEHQQHMNDAHEEINNATINDMSIS